MITKQVSLQKMLDMNADILSEGHFGVYHGRENVRKFIRSFMADFLKVQLSIA